ncbi:MAG: N-acetyltransferase [Calditrichaeota bacterium]|nr:MAG: N-acetyltransferase [Calditrichota bacterium]
MKIFLETERMILRQFTEKDAQNIFELDGDPEVMRFLTNGRGTSMDTIKDKILPHTFEFYENHDHFGYWAVDEKLSGKFIGWFLFRPDKEEPNNFDKIELGYRLKKSAWGKGFATEGSKVFLEKGFRNWKVNYIFAVTLLENIGSQRVMQKIGLNLEKEFIEPLELLPDFPSEEERKAVWYSQTRDEYLKL